MAARVWSTESVPTCERFGAWREVAARHILPARWGRGGGGGGGGGGRPPRHILPARWERDGPARAPYRGRLLVREVGGTRLVDLAGEGHRVVRSRAEAARATEDACFVEQEIGGAP